MQFIDLAAQQRRIRESLDRRISAVLDHGGYIMGPEVQEFERELSGFCGAKYALGCANGTDALQLALMALNPTVGDAIFCPSFTFASTAEVIPPTGATPVFVDVDRRSYNIDVESLERAIDYTYSKGLRPAGIIAVDLFGQPADYDRIEALAAAHGMWTVADSAQGFGGVYKGRVTGSIGTMATTSFFPAKPLGCYGDGGAVFTNDTNLANLVESYRVHGRGSHKYENERIGINSRLDTLQAAILLEKLGMYSDEITKRHVISRNYSEGLCGIIDTPSVPDEICSIWAQYTVACRDGQNRESIMQALKERGIPTAVYYPRPLHQQTAYMEFPRDPAGLAVSEALSQRVFSLPMHPYLAKADQERVIAAMYDALAA